MHCFVVAYTATYPSYRLNLTSRESVNFEQKIPIATYKISFHIPMVARHTRDCLIIKQDC